MMDLHVSSAASSSAAQRPTRHATVVSFLLALFAFAALAAAQGDADCPADDGEARRFRTGRCRRPGCAAARGRHAPRRGARWRQDRRPRGHDARRPPGVVPHRAHEWRDRRRRPRAAGHEAGPAGSPPLGALPGTEPRTDAAGGHPDNQVMIVQRVLRGAVDISLVPAQPVAVGDRLVVERGSQVIGELEILLLGEHSATCRIDREIRPITQGDRVRRLDVTPSQAPPPPSAPARRAFPGRAREAAADPRPPDTGRRGLSRRRASRRTGRRPARQGRASRPCCRSQRRRRSHHRDRRARDRLSRQPLGLVPDRRGEGRDRGRGPRDPGPGAGTGGSPPPHPARRRPGRRVRSRRAAGHRAGIPRSTPISPGRSHCVFRAFATAVRPAATSIRSRPWSTSTPGISAAASSTSGSAAPPAGSRSTSPRVLRSRATTTASTKRRSPTSRRRPVSPTRSAG